MELDGDIGLQLSRTTVFGIVNERELSETGFE